MWHRKRGTHDSAEENSRQQWVSGPVLVWAVQCWGFCSPDGQPDQVSWVIVSPPQGNMGRWVVWSRCSEKKQLIFLEALPQDAVGLWPGNFSKPCEKEGLYLVDKQLEPSLGRSRCFFGVLLLTVSLLLCGNGCAFYLSDGEKRCTRGWSSVIW